MCQRFSSYFRVLLYKPNKGEKFSQLQEVGGNGRNCIISEQAGSNANHGENDDFPWKDAAAEEAMHYCELLIKRLDLSTFALIIFNRQDVPKLGFELKLVQTKNFILYQN